MMTNYLLFNKVQKGIHSSQKRLHQKELTVAMMPFSVMEIILKSI